MAKEAPEFKEPFGKSGGGDAGKKVGSMAKGGKRHHKGAKHHSAKMHGRHK